LHGRLLQELKPHNPDGSKETGLLQAFKQAIAVMHREKHH
jgi:hypothetical protein